MILEQDIPPGGRLYYGKIAHRKRQIEQISAQIFEEFGFQEIVTPFFSYHQREVLASEQLIRVFDRENREVALRGDSSVDLIRLVLNRLNSSTSKWFYIQPVFRYPSREIYQIGGEWIGGKLEEMVQLNLEIFNRLGIEKISIVVGQVGIVEKVQELTPTSRQQLELMELNKLTGWVRRLAEVTKRQQLEDLFPTLPPPIRKEVKKLLQFPVTDCIIAPLLVPQFRYYTGLFYKIIDGKRVYAQGGIYRVKGVESVGFSIYTDQLLEREF